MNTTKERRNNMRITLIEEACTWLSNEDCLTSKILNISNDGMFIKSDKMPEDKDIEIRISLPSDLGVFSVPGRVIRRQWAAVKKRSIEAGFAVKFEIVQKDHQKIMNSYCIYLRNKQIITVSKKIIEELFNQGIIPPRS